MALLTPNDLLDWLVANQFLTAARALPFRSPPADYPDAMALAKDFLQRDWLTPYQLNHILQGKGDRLVLGPYRLVEKLGEGAMGQVFKCWSQKLEIPVAIKMIHKVHLASPKAMERFRREMETAGKLDHPNIVLLRDADEIDDHPFMVMEFVAGTDLSRLVKQDGPLPIRQAADYARQAALGLQHAWERGIVHRDIKPGNLLVSREGVLKISDFGLARFDSERGSQRRLTQHGVVLGTIDYIAPEQAENPQKADIRADIYSLGCTLYFLLTAAPPFPGANVVEKVSARMTGELADIRLTRPEVPEGLGDVIRRMTARAPAARYQTPWEVAEALQCFCAQEALAGAVPAPSEVGVLRARPVVSAVSPPFERPFNFEDADADVCLPPPVAEPVSRPRSRRTANKSRLVVYGLGGGGLALLLVLAALLRGCGSGAARDVYPANASLAITLKERDRTLHPGDLKHIIFTVQRTNFSGAVDVSLEKLPEWAGPNPNKVTLDVKKRDGEMRLFIYQFAPTGTSRIRIRAVAKNLTAEDWLQLTIGGPAAAE